MLREYFIGAIYLLVFVAFAIGISHRELKGAITVGAGVVVICAILLPLVDILRDLDVDSALDGILSDIDYDGTDSAIELAFEEGIAEYLATEHGVDKACVEVRVDGFDIATLKARRVYVDLSGRACLLDPKVVADEVARHFTDGGECEVAIRLG